MGLREHTIAPLSFSCKLAEHNSKAVTTLPPLQNSQALESPCSRKPAHAAERRTPAFARVTGKEVVVKYIHKPGRARAKGCGPHNGPTVPLLAPQPSASKWWAQAQTLLEQAQTLLEQAQTLLE